MPHTDSERQPLPAAALPLGIDVVVRPPPRLGRTLWVVIGVSLVIHVVCLILGHTLMREWRWPHHPVHAAVEMSGGLIAVWVAWMLLSLEWRNAGTSYNVWIAGAMIGMGLLDGLHALVYAGQEFVWLHSTATFVGGVLFAMVWVPKSWGRRLLAWWPWAVFGVVFLFGILSLAYPGATPRMLFVNEQGEKVFSLWAKSLNVVGGVLLIAAAVRLVTTYRQTKNVDDLLFFLHCSLFGAAAVMFEQSQLWDLPWWGWHLLRLMAYGVALWFVVLTEMREQQALADFTKNLKQLSTSLNDRVMEMTRELHEKNEFLEQSNMELQQFAYIASHDLQSPLRAVAGFAQFLKQDYRGKLDQNADDQIDRIVNGCKRMQTMIKAIIYLTHQWGRARIVLYREQTRSQHDGRHTKDTD
ncbi:MAG: hypothetical protein KDA88_03595 [Planctomycetaceae bacterium]|nr:hypothetical protein [Planctomycetaceae bacterium]MCB9953109.1 hypothetical protein [Planctomycetaceae bacterium]